MLSSDKPLIDPKEDRLGYAPFAQTLAGGILKRAPSEGLVIAVFGSWGSGKTTTTNFIHSYLKEGLTEGELLYVPFNPWWFSGNEDLTRRFFSQLLAVLSKSQSLENIRKAVADFADSVSEIPVPYSWFGKLLSRIARPRENDMIELKGSVDKLLREQGKRLLISIDDLDRLSSEEMRQVFQLVKAVADFPNVIYLLTLDKRVAVKALEGAQGLSGEQYLEKIIQVPFELPLPDKTALRNLFFERINEITEDVLPEGFDQTYWTNMYLESIDYFIQTPRDTVRLSNTLSVTYPAVKGEVNLVDFVAIETLRVFVPVVYDTIRKSPEYFVGSAHLSDYPRREDTEDVLKMAYEEVKDQNAVKPVDSMLKRLFPRLASNYGPEWASEWRQKLRVCSPDVFPIYFRLAFPSGAISNSEVKALLTLTGDSVRFGQELIKLSKEKKLDGTSKMREFLERLEDYTREQIPETDIAAVINAFFDIGDLLLLPEDEGYSFFSFGNGIIIGRIVYQLLTRLTEDQRFSVLKTAMSTGRSIAVPESEVVAYGQQHGKWDAQPESDRNKLISLEHVNELENILLRKIRNAANSGQLIKASGLPGILYTWKVLGSAEEVQEWVTATVSSDEFLAQFLETFLQRLKSQSMGEVAVRITYRLDPKTIEPFLDPSTIIDRVRKLVSSDKLSENQWHAAAQFIEEYDIRSQGKDPAHELRRIR